MTDRKPRRRLTVADKLNEIDSRAKKHGDILEYLAKLRATIIADERARATAILAELPEETLVVE